MASAERSDERPHIGEDHPSPQDVRVVCSTQAPIAAISIAYGRHGRVQVFAMRESAFEAAKAAFMAILEADPTSTFFLLTHGNEVLAARCAPATPEINALPTEEMPTSYVLELGRYRPAGARRR